MECPQIIVVTGPESTGKTWLCNQLVKVFDGQWIPEYARTYVEGLGHEYSYADVENIARHQIEQFDQMTKKGSGLYFFDTGLIITKVWFNIKFGSCPDFLLEAISTIKIDQVLLCEPDLPWELDPVRENGGEMRKVLFDKYCQEFERCGIPTAKISGYGNARLQCAVEVLRANKNLGI